MHSVKLSHGCVSSSTESRTENIGFVTNIVISYIVAIQFANLRSDTKESQGTNMTDQRTENWEMVMSSVEF